MTTEKIRKILSALNSKEELDTLLDELDELKKSVYKTGEEEWGKKLEISLPERVTSPLVDFLRDLKQNRERGEIEDSINRLRAEAQNMKIIKIYLAVEPDARFLQNLNHWLDKEIGEDVVPEVGVDKEMLGGIKVVWQGKYIEFTLSRMVEDFLAKNREVITSELKRKYWF